MKSRDRVENSSPSNSTTSSLSSIIRFAPVSPLIGGLILAGMTIVAILGFTDIDSPVIHPFRWFGLLIFRSQLGLQILFGAAVLAHAIEACIAILWCLRDFTRPRVSNIELFLWAFQTFLFGGPSLMKLRETTQANSSSSSDSDSTRVPLSQTVDNH